MSSSLRNNEVDVAMTQEERWMARYNEVKSFVEANHRNPSKYAPEERGIVNWCKQQKKLINAGALKEKRMEPFSKLLALIEENK